ncbi:Hsp70 family protein [Longispora albida]|uniref:Hsp70 family protein n=1 Tax=Longispora albida TaxID=203523 RepID=UPI00039BE8A7|nr:Hsp70 family protein [Longispora albida]
MNGFRLTIDYGTSNTVAMLRWPDGRTRPLLFDSSPLLPSAVFAAPDARLLIGRDAERAGRAEPARYEPNPKRHIIDGGVLLGEHSLPAGMLIAATLRAVAQEATRVAGVMPGDVAITYPATWAAVRRSVLADAARAAGLPAPRLVPEPVAAAAYFATALGHRVGPGQIVVVYDLGGGTLDVSAVRRTADGFEVVAVEGMPDFGGVDLDAIVVGLVGRTVEDRTVDPSLWARIATPSIADDHRLARQLWDDARAAKETLSRQPNASLQVLGLDLQVGQEEFAAAARVPLSRAAELTASVLRRFDPSTVAGLFLVGGSTRVPLVATTLHQATGIAPTVLEQPELVVAEGALHATAPLVPVQPSTMAGPPPGAVTKPRSGRKIAAIVAAGALAFAVLVAGGIYLVASQRSPGGTHADNKGGDGSTPGPLPSATGAQQPSGPRYGYNVDLCAVTDWSLVKDFGGEPRQQYPTKPTDIGTYGGVTSCTASLTQPGSLTQYTSFSVTATAHQYAANAKGTCSATTAQPATEKGTIPGVGTEAVYNYTPDTSGTSPLPGGSAGRYVMSSFTMCTYSGNLALSIIVISYERPSSQFKEAAAKLAKQIFTVMPKA